MNWQRNFRGKAKLGEPLKKHTTFKIGAAAEFFIEPRDAADLKALIEGLNKHKLPFRVIGAGSNILASDKGLKGAVIRLFPPAFKKLAVKGNLIEAGSGIRLQELIRAARENGLGGSEFLSGIPGTVGGALIMNAGTGPDSIGTLVKSIRVMDRAGRIKELNGERIKFSYRSSNLSKYIILSAVLRLKRERIGSIEPKIKELLARRRATQDYSLPSAGCVFKNPPGVSAGRLIDLCGLKGRRIGGAIISVKHGNFILNKGSASSTDVLKLMELIKKEVKKKFNVVLRPEVRIWQ